MRIKITIICCFVILVISGAVFFSRNNFFEKDTDCADNIIIIDLKKKLSGKQEFYKNNKDLDAVLVKYNILKINYANGKFFSIPKVNNNRAVSLLEFLNKHIVLDQNKKFSFYIPLEDCGRMPYLGGPYLNTPILMVDMDKETYKEDKYFIVPDFYLLNKNYYKKLNKIKKQGQNTVFEDRQDLVLWRGGQTGGLYNFETKDDLPRYNAVMFSFYNPSYLDARFVGHELQVEDSESGKKYIAHMNSIFGHNSQQYFINAEDQVRYKYIMSLDGNASSWERPLKIMVGGSVLLYHSNFIQFYTPYMLDNVHYVSFREDFSNLKNKIDWLRHNPEKAKEIANKGRDFAKTMTPQLFACYYQHVLEHIQRRFIAN